MIERLDGFTADGFGNVIPGDPEAGDVIRINGVIEQRYSPPVEPVAPIPSWDALTFKRRFTSQERITIRAAAASSGAVYDFLDLLDTAAATGTRIHANDPDVVGGLTAFENAGLISSGRAAVILSAAASP